MAELDRQEKAQREKDVAEGRLLLDAEIRKRLGLSNHALRDALKEKRMFALKGPSGKFYYPAFFADEKTYNRIVLEQVCMALGDIPAASKWGFFTLPRLSLGGQTPLEAIAKGNKLDIVMNAAKAFAEE